MIPPVQKRLDDFRQQSRVQASSVIISVFGDAILPRGGRIWLGSLIELLQPLQLNERLVRTSVFRLAKEAWITSETRGRRADYLLTPSGQRRFEEASRQIYASHSPLWDRRWRLILIVGEMASKERERLRKALFWQGFGSLGADCFLHPGADLTSVFDALMKDSMGHLLKSLKPLVAADSHAGISVSDSDMVQRVWDLKQLATDYSQFVETYQPILDYLRKTTPDSTDQETAFLVRVLLIHDFRRLLLRDPELPDVVLPPDWPGQTARMLCKEIYRRLLADSELHLDQVMRLADGKSPAASAILTERFQATDPLATLT